MSEKKISRHHVIGRLLTSAVYHDEAGYWQVLTDEKNTLVAYFAQMGVRLEVDNEMGMGYLRPTNPAEEEEFAAAGYAPLPKIIPPRILGYYPSLLCALLREALQHHEESSLESKHLYLDESQIITLMRPYMPEINDDKALKREVKKSSRARRKSTSCVGYLIARRSYTGWSRSFERESRLVSCRSCSSG